MRYFNKAMLVASAALCLNLSVFSQNITLKTGNVTVKEAMEQLKKSSGYSFVFYLRTWIPKKMCLYLFKMGK